MVPEMPRPVGIDRIGAGATVLDVAATPAERPAIAARLAVVGVAALACRFRLRRLDGVTIEAHGELRATVTEVCVVTLDPFEHAVADTFTVRFVPEGSEDDDPPPDSVDEVPFTGNAIDLGEAAIEQLALALDPYPRRPGAVLGPDAAGPAAGPFAALAARRAQ